ncbi:M43 family zinc metalloprotease [Flagellimonas allohymeniacidonis]|uniref:Peptidase M43 pregnancy-associated plasma-A domain-containing protein n=1 Tax=Flagellimonas allohymeniacidonis TaxID=2517819 RepID=A0A4Q8QLC4_9FLAO|nr:M43 family zinc metalloprotease [Allomuricauda hymeniacidonis]TAI49339.1 hypothetical protein EW142_05950 [Allomuricauda hymeniacidonis]
MRKLSAFLFLYLTFSCSESETSIPNEDTTEIYLLPVVVHVLHNGEDIGIGTNISDDRIKKQIELLNNDFRRKSGSRGFNNHPDGGDAKIEFVLATKDPLGNPTNGILRKQLVIDDLPNDIPAFEFEQYAHFSYWDSKDYINIWVAPYPEDLTNIVLGKATGPDSDLPGDSLFQKPLPGGAEGIIVNWAHFGETNLAGGRNLGRTLTHEMGHYLGLLHTWGDRNCETNDFCDDTPAVDTEVTNDQPHLGCANEDVMVANYMNLTSDAVMNIFTNDQITRMRYVLENSPRRASLLTSKGVKSI